MSKHASESELLRSIHLTIGGRPDVRLWRSNVGVAVPIGMLCPRCRTLPPIRYGLPGMGDLIGLIAPTGRLLSIETKSTKGRMTQEQLSWHEMVVRFGGVSCAPCRSIEEAVAAVEGAQR